MRSPLLRPFVESSRDRDGLPRARLAVPLLIDGEPRVVCFDLDALAAADLAAKLAEAAALLLRGKPHTSTTIAPKALV